MPSCFSPSTRNKGKPNCDTMAAGLDSSKYKMTVPSFLSDNVPPMGIYETLYAFKDSFGAFMGTEGTHPWSQGFPLTTKLTGDPADPADGPELPSSVEVTFEDRFYPKAWGHPALRKTIADYYNKYYVNDPKCNEGLSDEERKLKETYLNKTPIDEENIMIFAGGRPGIYTVLAFLKKDVEVRISNMEWPAYLDIMEATNTSWTVVPCNLENEFRPTNDQYYEIRKTLNYKKKIFPIISNPGNPTGHVRCGDELKHLVHTLAEKNGEGLLLDEAYEMYHNPAVSGLAYAEDLENSNLFFTGACTKGLQCPGIRIGWMIASKKNIETLSNFSSFGMGGVSHPSQHYAVKLFEPVRVAQARKAVQKHYDWQRKRYGEAFKELGLKIHTGNGGFYHWLELPEGMDCRELNKRLFKKGAAILEGPNCDMARPHSKDESYQSPYLRFFRFSFGPLLPETFEEDVKIFSEVYKQYKKDIGIA
ncbi:unnamed protein product [Amoebophrya sp. A120]|nr:unnamed protein product [Amoebophrya sp. A120]|eukprot:GSA120T00020721001.1